MVSTFQEVRVMDALFVSLVVRSVLIVAITDVLVFNALKKNLSLLTPLFVVEVILVTLVPLVISYWFDIIYRKMI